MPKFRRVTGLFRAATPDGPDEDYTPELEALNGQIEFTPRFRDGVVAYPRLDPPEFVRPEPIQAVLQDGRVMTQVTDGEQTAIQPVELMVSDDDEATQSWQWEAVFRDIRVGRWGDEVSISPLRFTVPDEHGPLDLTEVVGEKSGGTITVKGPRGAGLTGLRVEGDMLIVEWQDGELPVPMPIPEQYGARVEVHRVTGMTTVMAGSDLVMVDIPARSVADQVRPGRVGGWMFLSRTGPMVSLQIDQLDLREQGTNVSLGTLPEGFRPPNVAYGVLTTSSGGAVEVRINNRGLMTAAQYTARTVLKGSITFNTPDPPPSGLPGTPVT